MKKLAGGLWFPLAVLVVWQLAASAGLLNPLFFPAPTDLFRSAGRMIRSGELPGNVAATLGRTAAGFLIGSVFGLAAGLLMGSVARVRQSLEPVVAALNATPKLSLLPLFMLFFGVGETARITCISLASFVILSIHAFDAVRNIHPAWVDMAVNYGASRWRLVGTVYLPACLPQVFTGLRLALSSALVIAVSCELVNPSSGLGSMIWLAWQTFSTDRLYIALLVTATLGVLLQTVLRRLERRVVPWKAQKSGA